jgi:hypothetical protein
MTLQKFRPKWSCGLQDPEHGCSLTLALALQELVLKVKKCKQYTVCPNVVTLGQTENESIIQMITLTGDCLAIFRK